MKIKRFIAMALIMTAGFFVFNGGSGCKGNGATVSVVSTNPEGEAVDVDVSISISAKFNRPMNGASITTDTFTLTANGRAVNGSVSYDDSNYTATFTPATKLTLMTTYLAKISEQVGDIQGNALSDEYVWQFVTREGEWGTAELIETNDAGAAANPQVARDPAGNAVAVWQQSDGTRNNIWANRYTAGGTWSAAELIETNNIGAANNPQVAMDTAGNAVAVWEQSDGTRKNIWANRYTAGGTWGTAQLIETDNAGDATRPQVAMDPAGNAVAVWQQSDGTRDNIWANQYTAGGTWGTAMLVETDNAGSASRPQVAVNAADRATAVWQHSDGTRENILANYYVIGGSWGGGPQLVETNDAAHATYPDVAMFDNGDIIAVWQQSDGTRYSIWANYLAGEGWGTARLIEMDDTDHAFAPRVAVDTRSEAIAVWHQSDGTRYNIWANRYANGWGTARLIETDDSGNAWNPSIAVDTSGNAVVAWRQSDGTRENIWVNRFIWADRNEDGGGWGTARLIETDDTADASGQQVAVDAGGSAMVVWQQSDGVRDNIWANLFE